MYRAFYALPQSMVDSDGRPINAVHGYLDMSARLLRDYQPDELLHVFDADWRPAGRVAVYADYKGNRPEDPETLPPQFTLLRSVLDAYGATVVEAPEWEADDAIGVLCAQASDQDRIDIVTGDRDLIQLVRDETEAGPTIRILYTVRGVTKLEFFDEAAVTNKYGVSPQRYVDFAILRGDPSDGLPGVKGVGEKTAAKLIQQYESMEAILSDADSQSPRLAKSLLDAQEYIGLMQQIVPVRTDVALEISRPKCNEEQLQALVEHYRLGGPISRLDQSTA
ncbi:flap endonuclease [Chloroflexi bacterium TSY]|nr:flap endonuclease [Chloroflexi bacterium TSY]